jgi:hypothetical protein
VENRDNLLVARLSQTAMDLVIRVRDEDPEENGEWLANLLPDPADWFRLAFVLAAAVPDDRSWADLTRWAKVTALDDDPQRPGPKPCGTPAAAARHRYHREPIDPACRAALQAENQKRKAQERERKKRDRQRLADAA